MSLSSGGGVGRAGRRAGVRGRELPGGWRRLGVLIGLYAGLAAAGAAWIAWRSGVGGLLALAGDGWRGAVWGAGAAAGLVGLSAVGSRAFGWYRAMEGELREALGSMPLSGAVVLAVASGVAEELFFRGALQGAIGWAAAGVAFGLLHVSVARAWVPWTILATALGLLFGWAADRAGGIVGVTVAHAGVNAVNLWRLGGRTGPTAVAIGAPR